MVIKYTENHSKKPVCAICWELFGEFLCCDVAAYVCGERGGLIVEDPHEFGVSLNGVRGLDIEMEKKKVEEKLNELKEEGATEHDIELAMKDLGSKRFVPILPLL